MKWIWKYIVDDNGKSVEEEVTESEYSKRQNDIDAGVECLRQAAAASAKQLADYEKRSSN